MHGTRILAFSLALMMSCSNPPPPEEEVRELDGLTFPTEFLFGTAVAGFQVDMGCPTLPDEVCLDTRSDWYQFVTDPITVEDSVCEINGDPVDAGPGQWELFESDIALAHDSLHNNGYRFSIEWSRVFPEATDDAEGYEALKALASPEALATYHAMLDAMKARGITPMVTLNHYTLPVWIHDGVGCHVDLDTCSPRGWVDKDRTVKEIAKYAGFIAQEFGDKIDLWATLNEPFAVLLPGYLLPSPDRTNPPAVVLRIEEARIVLEGLVEAHARIYDALHANDMADANGDGVNAEVGVVYAVTPMAPADPENPLDITGAENLFYLYNTAYLDAVILGQFDGDLDGVAEEREDLQGRMDYLGINYYTRVHVTGTPSPVLPALSPLLSVDMFNLEVWNADPEGLYDAVMWATERYRLPIIISENGAPIEGEGEDIPKFMVEHLTWLARSLRDGADVRGYFFWSFVDNYEWNHGMSLRFGLFGIDPEDPTKTRFARPAAATYAEISENGRITDALAEAHPVSQ